MSQNKGFSHAPQGEIERLKAGESPEFAGGPFNAVF